MAKSYLIDTSAVIKYLNGSLPESNLDFIDRIVDEEVYLSFISEIELQVWNPPNEMDLAIYRDFVSRADILTIDNKIILETIKIRKLYLLKLPDAIIAATAITYNLILIADNDKDFLKVDILQYLNPNKLS